MGVWQQIRTTATHTDSEILSILIEEMETRERGYSKNVEHVSLEIHNLRIGHRDELRYLLRQIRTLRSK